MSQSNPYPLPATIIATIKVFLSPTDVPAFLELAKPVYDAVLQEPELAFFIMGSNPAVLGEFEAQGRGGVQGLMGVSHFFTLLRGGGWYYYLSLPRWCRGEDG
jgi:hypothetical protein